MLMLVIWLVLSGLVGLFASSRRNRSGVGWFLLAGLFSPVLALLVVAILQPRSQEEVDAADAAHLQPRSREELAANRKMFAYVCGVILAIGAVIALVSL